MIQVILADDHQIILDGISLLLENEQDIHIVGTAKTGDEAYALIQRNKVDVAILDIEMPGKTGIELMRMINEKFPEVKVVILSMYGSREFVEKSMSNGAKGYILKNKGYQELVRAIRQVQEGKTFISPEIVEVLVNALKEKTLATKQEKIVLTKREKEVLSMIAEGKSKHEISAVLFITPATVDTHRKNIMEKTGVGSSRELIVYSLKNKHLYS